MASYHSKATATMFFYLLYKVHKTPEYRTSIHITIKEKFIQGQKYKMLMFGERLSHNPSGNKTNYSMKLSISPLPNMSPCIPTTG